MTLRCVIFYPPPTTNCFLHIISILVLQLSSFKCIKLVSKHVRGERNQKHPAQVKLKLDFLQLLLLPRNIECLCFVEFDFNHSDLRSHFSGTWAERRIILEIYLELISKSDSVHLLLRRRHQVRSVVILIGRHIFACGGGGVSEWL